MKYYRKFLTVVLYLLLGVFSQYANAKSEHCVLLVYHHFTDDGPKSTSVSPKLFREHLTYLLDKGFDVLPLDEVVAAIRNNYSLPDKCVSLTADDGYKSIYDNAYPLLEEFKMPMAVFISTTAIDKNYPSMMTWEQLRDMSDFASYYNHSVSHSHLVDKELKFVVAEIINAQKRLEKELGVKNKFFAYPYGEFDTNTYTQLLNLGYVGFGQHSGTTSKYSDLLNMPRYAMAGAYAKMSSFIVKVNSLPMPVEYEQPKSMIIDEGDRPLLKIKFSRAINADERYQFACFVSGQDSPEINWIGLYEVTVQAVESLSNGRSRYNCTLPSGQKQRYYWYSKMWLAGNG